MGRGSGSSTSSFVNVGSIAGGDVDIHLEEYTTYRGAYTHFKAIFSLSTLKLTSRSTRGAETVAQGEVVLVDEIPSSRYENSVFPDTPDVYMTYLRVNVEFVGPFLIKKEVRQ